VPARAISKARSSKGGSTPDNPPTRNFISSTDRALLSAAIFCTWLIKPWQMDSSCISQVFVGAGRAVGAGHARELNIGRMAASYGGFGL